MTAPGPNEIIEILHKGLQANFKGNLRFHVLCGIKLSMVGAIMFMLPDCFFNAIAMLVNRKFAEVS